VSVLRGATKKEYAVVFPDFFYGQINEARHQPAALPCQKGLCGTCWKPLAMKLHAMVFKKIVSLTGMAETPTAALFYANKTGENPELCRYLFEPRSIDCLRKKVCCAGANASPDGDHAGQMETSEVMYYRPDW